MPVSFDDRVDLSKFTVVTALHSWMMVRRAPGVLR